MTNLERKKKELEIIKVSAAMSEMEFRIMEREEDIARIKENIENQKRRVEELTAELQGE